ncbi:MAG TPA: hypothetical protein VKX45_10075 [Bryobacteraceae bacterium]|jgi:hypothetical protein|nr:hypothetical protein [Bryobacteraceae bacterium]
MPAAPRVSPALQALLDKGLLDRLPASFSAFCFDQMKEWELLFPAERSYFERLFALLDRTPPQEFDETFRRLRDVEQRMGVNAKTFPKARFSLEQVDFLNRSPFYAEWRTAVAEVFGRIDPALDAEIARAGHPRLVMVVAPAQLPADPSRMWTRIAARGRRIALDPPDDPAAYLPQLGATSIPQLYAAKHAEPYHSWVIQAGRSLAPDHPAVVHYSYEALASYRKRLMREVQSIVEAKEVPGPRQLSGRLKQLKILASEGAAAGDPILAEFARAILLSGNGTLLINNTFVEWAAMQAVRRARPTVAAIGFGIRNKVKPFSSLLIYEDQDATNPIPSQADVLGSYVDLEIFYQYIWQEFEKYAEYRTNTVYAFLADGMEEMLVIAPPDFSLPAGPLKLPAVAQCLKDWVGV